MLNLIHVVVAALIWVCVLGFMVLLVAVMWMAWQKQKEKYEGRK